MHDPDLTALKRELADHAYRVYQLALDMMLADGDYFVPERPLRQVAEDRIPWPDFDPFKP